ncbi:MAG: hypothetical protein DI538_05320 [Azospira oryzae]|jgi:hypothetical protein|nr:MAG: hypothetical protein DI538_05320 [Azospira oryzae]
MSTNKKKILKRKRRLDQKLKRKGERRGVFTEWKTPELLMRGNYFATPVESAGAAVVSVATETVSITSALTVSWLAVVSVLGVQAATIAARTIAAKADFNAFFIVIG